VVVSSLAVFNSSNTVGYGSAQACRMQKIIKLCSTNSNTIDTVRGKVHYSKGPLRLTLTVTLTLTLHPKSAY